MDSFVVGQTDSFKKKMAQVEAERKPRDERLRVLLTTVEKGAIRAANTMVLREQVPHIVGLQPGVAAWGGVHGGAAASCTQASAAASTAALCKQVQ